MTDYVVAFQLGLQLSALSIVNHCIYNLNTHIYYRDRMSPQYSNLWFYNYSSGERAIMLYFIFFFFVIPNFGELIHQHESIVTAVSKQGEN